MNSGATNENQRPQAKAWRPAYQASIKFSLLLQLPILIVAALMLDEGRMLRFVAVAWIANWIVAAWIMSRRPDSPSRFDHLVIRYGILFFWSLAYLIAPFVWHVIGESWMTGLERLMVH